MPPSFVILIGQTGVGKSTLVNACIPNAGAPVSHTLASATQTVVAYSLKKDELILVDTPGLDSDKQTDAEILQLIVNWMASQAAAMAKQPSNKVVRCGVIIVQGGNAQNKPTPIYYCLRRHSSGRRRFIG
ncbi:hypothetical protein BKA70DRAFT_461614 [Coprinopsis sp. MPI-PUGE-AT-0042]|nr:hypothetical protein BKA70DRAFT_461614 [Coprinopsis sp. MPI-PUGE-AT-0042]